MAIITSKVLKLTFLTTGGKSFVISVAQPRENLTLPEAQAVMETVIAKNIFNSPSGELAAIRDIRVVDMTTNDLYDPPVT
ncbi:DUF2922 domain-containing protein [Desulfosporosinus nitroreducens]|uniref:DUF2922 domain-containing protein n=1 Tax=Desulfosporosinus nitroreducens TaxID=2018668 RepID=A0ABT8QJ31_9FIRM|nr:DUF2922 domain-containing protein [Desulfosporosinus nitroreducens]MDA8228692.1 DUF2922 domain-containing protein [Desulfitobacterium hafniense]MDO0821291.1 DUF2922 domain-containing protein [Desulfosporosinus nitroreducens]